MFKIAIVVCLLSAVCALPAPEADYPEYFLPDYQYSSDSFSYQPSYYNPGEPFNNQPAYNPIGYNNQLEYNFNLGSAYNPSGYNKQPEYTREDAKTSLERKQMKDWLKNMFNSMKSLTALNSLSNLMIED